MLHRHSLFRPRFIIVVLCALSFLSGQPKAKAQDTAPGIDFFFRPKFQFQGYEFL